MAGVPCRLAASIEMAQEPQMVVSCGRLLDVLTPSASPQPGAQNEFNHPLFLPLAALATMAFLRIGCSERPSERMPVIVGNLSPLTSRMPPRRQQLHLAAKRG